MALPHAEKMAQEVKFELIASVAELLDERTVERADFLDEVEENLAAVFQMRRDVKPRRPRIAPAAVGT